MSITLLSGDCRDVLPTLAANSVHCVVTSPPYYGLRDYGTAQWDGGDAACEHAQGRMDVGRGRHNSATFHGSMTTAYEADANPYRSICGKCGARRVDRQIGLEASPDEYLATMVAVFREVRRVLRPDGTLWLNIGDSYANSHPNPNKDETQFTKSGLAGIGSAKYRATLVAGTGQTLPKVQEGLANKQLLLMPARLALALQADGWWVRSDIIWSKPNPMPESCTDRPTSAYEHVFLLTRSARYFYDAEAVREESEPSSLARAGIMRKPSPKELTSIEVGNWSGAPGQSGKEYGIGRNLRNVWTIATHAYPQAHFATYPPELAERCIRAGTSERGCCAACGAPWRREVERSVVWDRRTGTNSNADRNDGGMSCNADRSITTTGWAASCACAADVVPATVLDPFAGAGTTLLVADRLQRHAIGIELNASYTTMAMERCRADAPLFVATPEPQPAPGFAQPDLFAEAAD